MIEKTKNNHGRAFDSSVSLLGPFVFKFRFVNSFFGLTFFVIFVQITCQKGYKGLCYHSFYNGVYNLFSKIIFPTRFYVCLGFSR